MNQTYLLLGANLGEPLVMLAEARIQIEHHIGRLTSLSGLYESEAWGLEDQPNFINQVIKVETMLSPDDLLKQTQKIETKLGRIRHEKWGARIIDIDILYYNNSCIHQENLIIPHPYIQERNFVLAPLTEIAADFEHPVLHKTNLVLFQNCKDSLFVNILK
ncbi:2-amino-4-hydroxy-6-hydroxymethyldihydropteridine diphosphokinase [Sphingobacterium spiritivorum]|uniref:2-amino-4-hydroxy-6- hydroxymethyldihydropteridine diphosphokinase n=1 Tax=Sphingobacterium spiritivorum TaxID=258 RepID=UPI00191AD4D1|nr:2-amino-4-hydroxy-6-hydroxymethyldihydropteridine diphosphokinase [Sphingobacterium spiritivorum]QQT24544.1 2-amino-4-hydroxy-6-hydroxymethyldihydropteridine diphosphokinase [Sphingobacterium spiritivorum]